MLRTKPRPAFERTFMRPPAYVAAAPGRIEFIGNHTDYNGGLVLGAAIDRHINVAVALRDDDRIRLTSVESWKVPEATVEKQPKHSGEAAWANYPLGVFHVLRKHGLKATRGFDLGITGDLEIGAGLSSSAALELATGLALAHLYKFETDLPSLARVGRQAENEFVGVPCGILDQATSALGQKDHLVRIDCKTETFDLVGLPPNVHFWIFNSKERHTLTDGLYAKRHEECRLAFQKLLAHYTSAKVLCDLEPAQVMVKRGELTGDLFKRARHVVEENARVKETVEALKAGDLHRVGQLLFASHESSRSLFENSNEKLDELVNILRGRAHVFGARLTGGGFGGAVMAMTDDHFTQTDAAQVAVAYAQKFGTVPGLLHVRTGSGAALV